MIESNLFLSNMARRIGSRLAQFSIDNAQSMGRTLSADIGGKVTNLDSQIECNKWSDVCDMNDKRPHLNPQLDISQLLKTPSLSQVSLVWHTQAFPEAQLPKRNLTKHDSRHLGLRDLHLQTRTEFYTMRRKDIQRHFDACYADKIEGVVVILGNRGNICTAYKNKDGYKRISKKTKRLYRAA